MLNKFLKLKYFINGSRTNIKDKLDIKEQQQKKYLLSLNFGMEICKTVSRSIAGYQAQKFPHVLN